MYENLNQATMPKADLCSMGHLDTWDHKHKCTKFKILNSTQTMYRWSVSTTKTYLVFI